MYLFRTGTVLTVILGIMSPFGTIPVPQIGACIREFSAIQIGKVVKDKYG